MNQDFARKKPKGKSARKKSGTATRRSGKGRRSADQPRSMSWFFSGVACGVFLSFLVWLGAQQPDPEAREETLASAEKPTPTASEKPTFSFYTLLPEQDVTVNVDPAEVDKTRRVEGMDQFLLQAGSFRQAADAERRRAELTLLGLDPRVQETQGQSGRWHRVYIGPFESRSKLRAAQSLTAQEGIETLLLKRPAS